MLSNTVIQPFSNQPHQRSHNFSIRMWSLCKIAFSIQVALGTVSAALIPAQAPVEDQLFFSPTTQFTKVQQNDSLCDARSRQWTGKVPVTNGNSLFYCTFDRMPCFDSWSRLKLMKSRVL